MPQMPQMLQDYSYRIHHPWRYYYVDTKTLKEIVKKTEKIRSDIKLIDANYNFTLPIPRFPSPDKVKHVVHSKDREGANNFRLDPHDVDLIEQAKGGIHRFIELEAPRSSIPPPVAPLEVDNMLIHTSQLALLQLAMEKLDSYFYDFFDHQLLLINEHYIAIMGYINSLEDKATKMSMTMDNTTDIDSTKSPSTSSRTGISDQFSNFESVQGMYDEVHQIRDYLREYIIVNYILCVKALKTHDKLLHVHGTGSFIEHIHRQPFYKSIDRTLPYTQKTTKDHHLRVAAQNGDFDGCIVEIATGANVNQQNEFDGTTPLMIAALNGHDGVVQLLIQYKANINAVNHNGTCALTHAIINNHDAVAEVLITHNADVNIQDQGSLKTPLMYASMKGMSRTTDLLLIHGADVHLTDRIKQTALLLACENGQSECVKLLLAYGSSIVHQNDLKQNSIAAAASGNHVKCLEQLLKSKQALELIDSIEARGDNGEKDSDKSPSDPSSVAKTTLDQIDPTDATTDAKNPITANKDRIFQVDVDLTLPTSALPIVSASVRGNVAALDLLLKVFTKWHPEAALMKPVDPIVTKKRRKRKVPVTSSNSKVVQFDLQAADLETVFPGYVANVNELCQTNPKNAETQPKLIDPSVQIYKQPSFNPHNELPLLSQTFSNNTTSSTDIAFSPVASPTGHSDKCINSQLNPDMIDTDVDDLEDDDDDEDEDDEDLEDEDDELQRSPSSAYTAVLRKDSTNSNSSRDTNSSAASTPLPLNSLDLKLSNSSFTKQPSNSNSSTQLTSQQPETLPLPHPSSTPSCTPNSQTQSLFRPSPVKPGRNDLSLHSLDVTMEGSDIITPTHPLTTTHGNSTSLTFSHSHNKESDSNQASADVFAPQSPHQQYPAAPRQKSMDNLGTPSNQSGQIVPPAAAIKTTTMTTRDDDDVGMLSPLVSTMTMISHNTARPKPGHQNITSKDQPKDSSATTTTSTKTTSKSIFKKPGAEDTPSLQAQVSVQPQASPSGQNANKLSDQQQQQQAQAQADDPTTQPQQHPTTSSSNSIESHDLLQQQQQALAVASIQPSLEGKMPVPAHGPFESLILQSPSDNPLPEPGITTSRDGVTTVVEPPPIHADVEKFDFLSHPLQASPQTSSTPSTHFRPFSSQNDDDSQQTDKQSPLLHSQNQPPSTQFQTRGRTASHEDVISLKAIEILNKMKTNPDDIVTSHEIAGRAFQNPPLVLDIWEDMRYSHLKLQHQLAKEKAIKEGSDNTKSAATVSLPIDHKIDHKIDPSRNNLKHPCDSTPQLSQSILLSDKQQLSSADGHQSVTTPKSTRSRTPSALRPLKKQKKVTYCPTSIPWIDTRDKYGCTALLRAAEYHHVDTMKLLLKNGANPDVSRIGGRLCTTNYQDDENGHQRIVSRKYSYNGDLSTPLMLCANHNNIEGVKVLLQYKANLDIQRLDGATALLCAADRGHVDIVRLLLEAGADCDLATETGFSPFIRCSVATYKDQQAYLDCIQLLLQYGADINAKTQNGSTGLILAATRNVQKCIQAFLAHPEIDLNAQDHENCTALIRAAMWGHISAIQGLIKAGADMNIQDYNGRTALHLAAAGGHYRSVKKLLSSGADWRIVDVNGVTARELATRMNHVTLLSLFKEFERADIISSAALGSNLANQSQNQPPSVQIQPGTSTTNLSQLQSTSHHSTTSTTAPLQHSNNSNSNMSTHFIPSTPLTRNQSITPSPFTNTCANGFGGGPQPGTSRTSTFMQHTSSTQYQTLKQEGNKLNSIGGEHQNNNNNNNNNNAITPSTIQQQPFPRSRSQSQSQLHIADTSQSPTSSQPTVLDALSPHEGSLTGTNGSNVAQHPVCVGPGFLLPLAKDLSVDLTGLQSLDENSTIPPSLAQPPSLSSTLSYENTMAGAGSIPMPLFSIPSNLNPLDSPSSPLPDLPSPLFEAMTGSKPDHQNSITSQVTQHHGAEIAPANQPPIAAPKQPFLLFPFEDCASLRVFAGLGEIDRVQHILDTHKTRLHGYGFGAFTHTGPQSHLRSWADLPDQFGNSALIVAAAHGRQQCVQMLLQETEHTVNINLKNHSGRNALMSAARRGYSRCVQVLLQHPGIDVEAVDELGHTSVHVTAKRGQTHSLLDILFYLYLQRINTLTEGINMAEYINSDANPDLKNLNLLNQHIPTGLEIYKTNVTNFIKSAQQNVYSPLEEQIVRRLYYQLTLSPRINYTSKLGKVLFIGCPDFIPVEENEHSHEGFQPNTYFTSKPAPTSHRSQPSFTIITTDHHAHDDNSEPLLLSPLTPLEPILSQNPEDDPSVCVWSPESPNSTTSNEPFPPGSPSVRSNLSYDSTAPDDYINPGDFDPLSSAARKYYGEGGDGMNDSANKAQLTQITKHNIDATAYHPHFISQIRRIHLLPHHVDTIINGMNHAHETPLYLAAAGGHSPPVQLLLRHGAIPDLVHHNPENPDEFYDTPLIVACLHGHTDIVGALLDFGANPNLLGHTLTPLNAAAFAGHVDILELLLKHNVNIEAKDRFGSTALICAVRSGHLDCVVALIKHGANVNALGENGSTALITAALEHQPTTIFISKALLLAGAHVNCRGEGGTTALVHAADKGFADVVQLLLDYGADTEIPNIHGHTPLMRTVYWNRNSWNNHACMKLLLETNTNVNHIAEHGNTTLHIAAYRAFTDAIKMLLQHGADVNVTNCEGTTPLMSAAAWGSISAIEALLDGGAHSHVVDQYGRTALWLAVAYSRLDAVRILLARKSPWGTKAYNNKTPLEIARENGNEQIVALLEYHLENEVFNHNDSHHPHHHHHHNIPLSHQPSTHSSAPTRPRTQMNASVASIGGTMNPVANHSSIQPSHFVPTPSHTHFHPQQQQQQQQPVYYDPHSTNNGNQAEREQLEYMQNYTGITQQLYSNPNTPSHSQKQSQQGQQQSLPTNPRKQDGPTSPRIPSDIYHTIGTNISRTTARDMTSPGQLQLQNLFCDPRDSLTNHQPQHQQSQTFDPLILQHHYSQHSQQPHTSHTASKKKIDKRMKQQILLQQQQQQHHHHHHQSAAFTPRPHQYSASQSGYTTPDHHIQHQHPHQHTPQFTLSSHKPNQPQPLNLTALHTLSQQTSLANLVNRNSTNNNNTQPSHHSSSSIGLQPIASTSSSSSSSFAQINGNKMYGGNQPNGYDDVLSDASDDSISVSSCSLNDNASISSSNRTHSTQQSRQNTTSTRATPPFTPSRCYLPPPPATPSTVQTHEPVAEQKKKFTGSLKEALAQAGVDQSFYETFAQQGLSDVGDLKFLRDSDYDQLMPALFPRRKLQRWIDENL